MGLAHGKHTHFFNSLPLLLILGKFKGIISLKWEISKVSLMYPDIFWKRIIMESARIKIRKVEVKYFKILCPWKLYASILEIFMDVII